jgi:hypothetical protein
MRADWIFRAVVVNGCWFALMMQKSVSGLTFSSQRLRSRPGQRAAFSLITPDHHDDTPLSTPPTAVDSSFSTRKSKNSLDFNLAASRLGLDPALNRFHAPIVNHENYSFSNWPEAHTFPVRTSI